MNCGAAKAIKYGGVEPEEASKFVTLDSAEQLRIEGRVGSLEPGKDGDNLETATQVTHAFVPGRVVDLSSRSEQSTHPALSQIQNKIRPNETNQALNGITRGSRIATSEILWSETTRQYNYFPGLKRD